jgi:hypothetical protein
MNDGTQIPKFVNVTQHGGIFLFHIFPLVGRHHLTWITPGRTWPLSSRPLTLKT